MNSLLAEIASVEYCLRTSGVASDLPSNVETTQPLLLNLRREFEVDWLTERFMRVASDSLGLIAHHRYRTYLTMTQFFMNQLLQVEKVLIVDSWNLIAHKVGKSQKIFDIVTRLELMKVISY